MPRSKRNQKVSLTKTKKKGLERKQSFIDEVKKCVSKYENIFLFSYENMRNKFMQDIRLKYRDNSRFFFGKNRVMSLSLGRTSAEEVAENVHLISEKLNGDRGLMFTNASKEEILSHFNSLQLPDFAKTGCEATDDFEIPEGLLQQFSHTLEPYFRTLGLPVELRKGVPALYKPYLVCKKGETLSSDKAKILKLFDVKMAYFKLTLEYLWSRDGSFEDLSGTKKPKSKDKKIKENKLQAINSEGEDHVDEDTEMVDANSS